MKRPAGSGRAFLFLSRLHLGLIYKYGFLCNTSPFNLREKCLMTARFTYIILLVTLLFCPETLQASGSGGDTGPQSSAHDSLLCLDCHVQIKQDANHPSVEGSNASCLECHETYTGFRQSDRYKVNCLNCHSRHDEKVANDEHSGVPCKACHLQDLKPVRSVKNNSVEWRYEPVSEEDFNPHRLITGKEKMCSRCHYKGNNLGAPEHVLPAKGIICMPCHAATFSTGGIPSIVAMIIFLIGISGIVIMWCSAGRGQTGSKEHGAFHLFSILVALIFDGIFQRRLFRASFKRWAVHAMIFFPFIIRFIWGIFALVSSLTDPQWNLTQAMLDKNNPVTGLVFDVTGLFILAGGCLMLLNKRAERKKHGIKGLPKYNNFVQILLGGVVITGFIVEGARIAMTGSPDGSQYAFIGYLVSRVLMNYYLNGIYAYLWYVHAVLTAAFVACLPFSRMFHIFLAPLSLLFKEASKD